MIRRLPGGYRGSNEYLRPEHTGHRPSYFGYNESPFSIRSFKIFPVTVTRINLSLTFGYV